MKVSFLFFCCILTKSLVAQPFGYIVELGYGDKAGNFVHPLPYFDPEKIEAKIKTKDNVYTLNNPKVNKKEYYYNNQKEIVGTELMFQLSSLVTEDASLTGSMYITYKNVPIRILTDLRIDLSSKVEIGKNAFKVTKPILIHEPEKLALLSMLKYLDKVFYTKVSTKDMASYAFIKDNLYLYEFSEINNKCDSNAILNCYKLYTFLDEFVGDNSFYLEEANLLKRRNDSIQKEFLENENLKFDSTQSFYKNLNEKYEDLVSSLFVYKESQKTFDDLRRYYTVLKKILFYTCNQGKDASASAPNVQINQLNSFWAEAGASFDFNQGVSVNNFSGGLFFFKNFNSFQKKSELINKNDSVNLKTKKFGKVSLFFGLDHGQSIANNVELLNFSRQYFILGSSPILNDSIGILRDTGTLRTIQRIKNIGLCFSPQVNIWSNYNESFRVDLSFHSELLFQRVSIESDFSSLHRRDTSVVPLSQINLYNTQNPKTFSNIRAYYLGVGLPIYYKDDNLSVSANPTFGWTTQLSSSDFSKFLNNTQLTQSNWRPFYILQLGLCDEKFGITFRGEIRGLFENANQPLITLNLVKKLNLSKLLAFLIPAF